MTDKLLLRSFTLNKDSIQDEANRTIELVFSSSNPIDQGSYNEVLNHADGAVDLTFMLSGRAPVLLDHDQTKQIGVIESVSNDGTKCRAVVRFGNGPLATEIWQDIVDGIRGNVSVGCSIDHDSIEVIPGSDDSPATVVVNHWSPKELSIVAVPADESVGIGRSALSELGIDVEKLLTRSTKNPEPKSVGSDKPVIEPTKEFQMTEQEMQAALETQRKAEVDRIRALTDLGTRHNMATEAMEAITGGASIDQFRASVLETISTRSAATAIKPIGETGLSTRERTQYSLCRAVMALKTGNWKDAGFEREISQDIAKRTGKDTAGLYVPMELLTRAAGDPMLAATATEGAELVGTSRLGHIPPLYNRTALVQAGAQVITGLVDNAEFSKSGAGSYAWLGEDDTITPNTPSTGLSVMSPKTARGLIKFSHKLMRQSNPSIEALLRSDMESGIAAFIDAGCLTGTGLSNQPTGILNVAGVGAVVNGTDGAALTWAKVNEFVGKPLTSNLAGNRWIGNPKTATKLNTTPKVASTDSVMVMDGYESLLGYGYVMTNNMPSNLVKGTSGAVCSALAFGDFSQVVIGQWGATEIALSESDGDDFAKGLLAIRVITYVDVLLRYAAAVAVSQDVLTA